MVNSKQQSSSVCFTTGYTVIWAQIEATVCAFVKNFFAFPLFGILATSCLSERVFDGYVAAGEGTAAALTLSVPH